MHPMVAELFEIVNQEPEKDKKKADVQRAKAKEVIARIQKASAANQQKAAEIQKPNDEPTARISLNETDENGDTALNVAIWHNHQHIAHELIASQCDLNKQTKYGETALMLALFNNRSETIAELIDAKHCNLDLQSDTGETALTRSYFRPEFVRQMIETKRCNLNLQNSRGNTALIRALQDNCQKSAFRLILAGADLNVVNEDKMTALDYAVKNAKVDNDLGPIDLLLTHNAQIQYPGALLALLLSVNKNTPGLLECLTRLCDQQQKLRDTKVDNGLSMKLAEASFETAKAYLKELNVSDDSSLNPVAKVVENKSDQSVFPNLRIKIGAPYTRPIHVWKEPNSPIRMFQPVVLEQNIPNRVEKQKKTHKPA